MIIKNKGFEMFGYMDMNMTMFHGFAMFIFWLFIIVIIFFLINDSNKKYFKDSPIDILKKRLARGEITKEQFEEIKKILE